jgi:hypothetical protein
MKCGIYSLDFWRFMRTAVSVHVSIIHAKISTSDQRIITLAVEVKICMMRSRCMVSINHLLGTQFMDIKRCFANLHHLFVMSAPLFIRNRVQWPKFIGLNDNGMLLSYSLTGFSCSVSRFLVCKISSNTLPLKCQHPQSKPRCYSAIPITPY